jgi:hypothetical protein
MGELKTKATAQNVIDFLMQIEDEVIRKDV